jgi:hypothetical protein
MISGKTDQRWTRTPEERDPDEVDELGRETGAEGGACIVGALGAE